MPRKNNMPVHPRKLMNIMEASLNLNDVVSMVLSGYPEKHIGKTLKISVDMWEEDVAPEVAKILHDTFSRAATKYFAEQKKFELERIRNETFCNSKRCNSMTYVEFSSANDGPRDRPLYEGVLDFEVSLIPDVHVQISIIEPSDDVPRITQVIGENNVEYDNDYLDLDPKTPEAFLGWIIYRLMDSFKRLRS